MKRPLAAATIILAAWADAALGLGAAAQTISGEIRGELVSLGPARIVLRAPDGKERSAGLDSVIAVAFSSAERDTPPVPNARLAGGGQLAKPEAAHRGDLINIASP